MTVKTSTMHQVLHTVGRRSPEAPPASGQEPASHATACYGLAVCCFMCILCCGLIATGVGMVVDAFDHTDIRQAEAFAAAPRDNFTAQVLERGFECRGMCHGAFDRVFLLLEELLIVFSC